MNKFNILIAMLVCLNICGCSDFLEEDPKGKLTTDNFYNSESDARQAINGVYRRLSDSWQAYFLILLNLSLHIPPILFCFAAYLFSFY